MVRLKRGIKVKVLTGNEISSRLKLKEEKEQAEAR